jgi:hypothetical protein
MTKQEILDAFIQAEKDWSEPIKRAQETDTHWGLCLYFRRIGFSWNELNFYLEQRWLRYSTLKSIYHFNSLGNEPQGRAERLDAIRKVINDLKSELG